MAQPKRNRNEVYQIEARGTTYALTSNDCTKENIIARERDLARGRRQRTEALVEFENAVTDQRRAKMTLPEWEEASKRVGTLGALLDKLLNQNVELEGEIEAMRKLQVMLAGMRQQQHEMD